MPPLNYEELIGDRTAQSLKNVFAEVLRRKKSRVDPIRSGFGKIHREEISVSDKTLFIRAYLASHPHADFREMLEREDSKEEIIVTFLVILELMKNQMIRITQEETFGKIAIDLVDPNEPEPEALPQEREAEPQEREPDPAPIPADMEAEPELILPEHEEEPEPIPAEPEEEPELIPEEPEEEPEPIPEEPEPEPAGRTHLVGRARQNRMTGSRHFFPRGGRRTSGSIYRNARSVRIWNRKRNLGSVLRQLGRRG